MKKFKIEYLNYEGNISSTEVEVEDHQSEPEAGYKAILEDTRWDDGIYKIINSFEICENNPLQGVLLSVESNP